MAMRSLPGRASSLVAVAVLSTAIGGVLALPASGATRSTPAVRHAPRIGLDTTSQTVCAANEFAVTEFPAPPTGVTPLNATPAQAAQYGFPPKPSGDAGSSAVATWQNAMAHALIYDASTPKCVSTQPAPAGATHANYYGSIWAGHDIANSDVGTSAPIQFAQTEWRVPTVTASITGNLCDASGSNGVYNANTDAVWVGIGHGNNGLFQTGTDSCQTVGSPTYQFWNEVLPYNSVNEGPAITGGDNAYAEASYTSGTSCNFWDENVTTGHYQAFVNTGCSAVHQGYADFILERTGVGANPPYTPTNLPITGSNFGTSTNDYGLSTGLGTRYYMTSNCTSSGTVYTSGGAIDGSGNFTDNYSASGVPSGPSC
jgi:hypothetical protein